MFKCLFTIKDEFVCKVVARVVCELGVKVIVAFISSGFMVRNVVVYRFMVFVVATLFSNWVVRQLII